MPKPSNTSFFLSIIVTSQKSRVESTAHCTSKDAAFAQTSDVHHPTVSNNIFHMFQNKLQNTQKLSITEDSCSHMHKNLTYIKNLQKKKTNFKIPNY